MTSYGGYQRTGYGAQGGDDGGGFMGASQQGSSQDGEKRNHDTDSLRPVTIKQLLEAKQPYPDKDNLQIDGVTTTQVTLVGQVRSVNQASLWLTYHVDDGTGLIDVKKFVDADKPDATPRFVPDTYIRVFGSLKSFNGKYSVTAHAMRAIEDFNEVNYHLLEATYVHLTLTSGASAAGGQQQGGAGNMGGDGGDSMFVDGGYGAGAGGNGFDSANMQGRLAPCSRRAQTMFKFLANAPPNPNGDGVHISKLIAGTGLSKNEIMMASEELLNQGLIYTTDDDETWAVLEC